MARTKTKSADVVDKRGVRVDVKDLYQLLVAECRYGYGRNNHLMPWGAYEHVREYLPIMYATDPEFALSTACQVCEECISDQLCMNFYDGLDDEHGSRASAVAFVEYLLEWIHSHGKDVECPSRDYENYLPYDYDRYRDNVARADSLRYRVFETDSFEPGANKVREITSGPVGKREADEALFLGELGVTEGVMNRVDVRTERYPVRVVGERLRIIEPESHKGRTYLIELDEGSVTK